MYAQFIQKVGWHNKAIRPFYLDAEFLHWRARKPEQKSTNPEVLIYRPAGPTRNKSTRKNIRVTILILSIKTYMTKTSEKKAWNGGWEANSHEQLETVILHVKKRYFTNFLRKKKTKT